MDEPAKKLLRCAIYTRKSTEYNLDLEFNSLDAQREACEAYIKSQAREGWRLIPDHYVDGAFSGASLDRPALQKLLAEISTGKVDVILVYKVDRLTRSLADFAKLVELFEKHSVSFVSVTQHFNTASSMGRLTLNVLLPFAQFEREVIGERVRDKIAASKAKGIWVGGSVPLGYASVNKKLVVVPEEAKAVCLIFRRYLELGSIRDLAEDLDRVGVRTRRRTLSTGEVRGGIKFGVGSLAHLLRNRLYIGEVVYRRAIHPGEHEPILDRTLFDAVQAKLSASGHARKLHLKASPSVLAGRIFDDKGNRMSPTHTNKKGVRYRYYVSHTTLQKRIDQAGRATRVPAHDVEISVTKALRGHFDKAGSHERSKLLDRDLIERLVDRIIVKSDAIEIHLTSATKNDKTDHPKGGRRLSENNSDGFIKVPWAPPANVAVKGVLNSHQPLPAISVSNRGVLLTAIAKARAWVGDIAEGRVASFAEIAKREGKVERHIRLLAPLAFVSPVAISKIIDGAHLPMSVTELAKGVPYLWNKYGA
jgi:DNA invertase Pin-like site-specific DNA recombinase